MVLLLKILYQQLYPKTGWYRDVLQLSTDSWKCEFFFRDFWIGTSKDHLGSSPKTIGSTWIGQKGPLLAPWKLEGNLNSKSLNLISALAQLFGLRFWLGVSQNEATVSPEKMAYSWWFSDQLIISNKLQEKPKKGKKNQWGQIRTGSNFLKLSF